MAPKTATKPASTTDAAEKAEKTARPKKPNFDLATAMAGDKNVALDDKGRLTAVPTNWTTAAAKLTKKQFASSDLYFDWLISLEEGRIATIKSKIDDLNFKKEEATKGPDPVKTAARKMKKWMENIEKAKELLAAEGVDVDDLVKNL